MARKSLSEIEGDNIASTTDGNKGSEGRYPEVVENVLPIDVTIASEETYRFGQCMKSVRNY